MTWSRPTIPGHSTIWQRRIAGMSSRPLPLSISWMSSGPVGHGYPKRGPGTLGQPFFLPMRINGSGTINSSNSITIRRSRTINSWSNPGFAIWLLRTRRSPTPLSPDHQRRSGYRRPIQWHVSPDPDSMESDPPLPNLPFPEITAHFRKDAWEEGSCAGLPPRYSRPGGAIPAAPVERIALEDSLIRRCTVDDLTALEAQAWSGRLPVCRTSCPASSIISIDDMVRRTSPEPSCAKPVSFWTPRGDAASRYDHAPGDGWILPPLRTGSGIVMMPPAERPFRNYFPCPGWRASMRAAGSHPPF